MSLSDAQWAEARASLGWSRDEAAHRKLANRRFRALTAKIDKRRMALEEKQRAERAGLEAWIGLQKEAYRYWSVKDERDRVDRRLTKMFGADR